MVFGRPGWQSVGVSEQHLRIGLLGAAAIAPGALIGPARLTPRVEVVAFAARERARA